MKRKSTTVGRGGRTVVLLSCKCIRYFGDCPPEIGQLISCAACCKDVKVILTNIEYHYQCQGCITHKYYGTARVTMEIEASKHRDKYPTHIVELKHGTKVYLTLGQRDNQLVLALDSDDEIPF